MTQPPLVYVRERLAWQYKKVAYDLSKVKTPTKEELDALGSEGWKLAGLFKESDTVYCYFKRLAD